MKQSTLRYLLLYTLFVAANVCFTAYAQRKSITFYGEKCWMEGSAPTSTPIKEIKVIYEGNTPVAIMRVGHKYNLSWEDSGDDFETYGADGSYFSFRIADDKSIVVELYDFPGFPTYTSYTRTPNTSYNGGGYSGGYNGSNNGGSFNGGNNNGNNSRSSVYTTCTSCNGTGVCSGCGGTKGKWMDTGYYAGNNARSWIDCGSCRGSGRCPICYGRGKL